ncbi:hypothetical protein HPG69_012182, partial [Diceros bicornis minor]
QATVCPELSSSPKESCVISCFTHKSCPSGSRCCTQNPAATPAWSPSPVTPLALPQLSPVQEEGGNSFVTRVRWGPRGETSRGTAPAGPVSHEGLARRRAAAPGAGPLGPEPCWESSECSRDDQSENNWKCCFSTCAMRHLDPDTGERPGDPSPSTPSPSSFSFCLS